MGARAGPQAGESVRGVYPFLRLAAGISKPGEKPERQRDGMDGSGGRVTISAIEREAGAGRGARS